MSDDSHGGVMAEFTNVGVSPITINGVRIEPGDTETVTDPDPADIARFTKQGSLKATPAPKKEKK